MFQPNLAQFIGDVQMAEDRIRQDRADARAYRSVYYPVRNRAPQRRVSVWLGSLFLEWGSKLRERKGDVDVTIAFEHHRSGHSPAA